MLSSLKRTLTKLPKLMAIVRKPTYLHALVSNRVAAGVEHELVLALIDCKTVVDVGANRGQFALVVRHLFPEAKVISFEPLDAPAQQFRITFANDPMVTLHHSAIGPTTGNVDIHISARDDSSSLLPITDKQNELFPGTREVSVKTIQVARLRDLVSPELIQSPALLKIDVQGFELSALEGCEDLLERFSNIYVECSFVELYKGQALADEVIAWLRARKFILNGVYNISNDATGRAIQGDFMFKAA